MENKPIIVRSLMIATIVNTDFLKGLREFCREDLLGSGWRWLFDKCSTYLDKYGEAPGRNIETLWEGEVCDPEVKEDLERLLSGLSEEWEELQKEPLNAEPLLEEARKWFEREEGLMFSAHLEGAYETGDFEYARQLQEQHNQYLERLCCKTGSRLQPIDLSEEKELIPVKWIIPGLIPAGLTLIAGRPKVGKTELLMNIAVDLALGRKVLGSIEVEPRKVLFCALETNENKLRLKTERLLGEMRLEKSSFMALPIGHLPPMDQGCMEELEGLVERYGFDLVIIDTLERIRSDKDSGNANAYRQDSKLLKPLHAFAQKHAIALVISTHTTKLKNKDPIREVTGSFGQTGTADEIIVMMHAEGSARYLHYEGRELEVGQWLLKYEDGKYVLEGQMMGMDEEMSEQRRIILHFFKHQQQPVTRKEVVEAIGGRVGKSLDNLLKKLHESGKLVKPGYGKWAIPTVAHRWKARNAVREAGQRVMERRREQAQEG